MWKCIRHLWLEYFVDKLLSAWCRTTAMGLLWIKYFVSKKYLHQKKQKVNAKCFLLPSRWRWQWREKQAEAEARRGRQRASGRPADLQGELRAAKGSPQAKRGLLPTGLPRKWVHWLQPRGRASRRHWHSVHTVSAVAFPLAQRRLRFVQGPRPPWRTMP